MLELLSDKEIMDEYVLSKIIRYNHRNKLQDESVATHSFYVSLFCLKILSKLNLDKDIDRQVLILAALHDTAESMTSDIPHDVKNNYPAMQKILDEIERDYYEQNWPTYFDDIYNSDEIVQLIVKLADAYSVYQYCINENTLGNVSVEMLSIKIESERRIKTYTNQINNLKGGHKYERCSGRL